MFAEAEAGVNCLHEDARWPVWSALDVYRNILDAIEANDYDNFTQARVRAEVGEVFDASFVVRQGAARDDDVSDAGGASVGR